MENFGLIVFMLSGLGVFILGIHLFRQSFLLQKTGHITTGNIVEIVESRNSKNRKTFAPKIIFKDMEGKEQTHIPSHSSSRINLQVGQTLEIIYITRADRSLLIKNNLFFDLWGQPAILCGAGLLFIFLPLLMDSV